MAFVPAYVTFDKNLELAGYWLRHEGVAGDWFYTVLTWRARQKLDADYKVYVHILDANGHTVFQRDKLALSSLLPMSAWAPGESMRDAYRMVIPKSLPVGEYRVVIGVYDPSAQTPLLAVISDGLPVTNGAVTLGTLQVHTR